MIATEKQPFTPTAVLITEAAEFKDGNRTAVDPKLVTLLHLDSNENSGWLYTREEWDRVQDEPTFEPRIYRRYGKHEGLEEGERVELLPDMWIVKIEDRDDWLDTMILDRTSRAFSVYVLDRRQHFHLCQITPSYEAYFLGSQYEPSRELTDDERDELEEAIRTGDSNTEPVTYFDVSQVERWLANACREGCLPAGNAGGYKVEGVVSVVTADAVAEIQEAYCQSEL